MAQERIQKILAAAGFGTRQECEQLVVEGHVRVNAHVRDTLPLFVDPEHDRITVNGKPIRVARAVYFILHKPPGFYTHDSNLQGRKSISILLERVRERVFPVGRTEPDCSGLVLLTNDKALAQDISDPRRGLAKTYRVETKGPVEQPAIDALRNGMRLSDGRTTPMAVTVVHQDRQRAVLEVIVNDRLQREIPRVLAKHGVKVKHVTRVAMGRLSIRKLPVGGVRMLTPDEVEWLKKVAQGQEDSSRSTISATPRRTTAERRSVSAPRGRRPASSTRRKSAEKTPQRTEAKPPRPPSRPAEIETRVTPQQSGGGKKKRRIIGPEGD